MALLAAADRRLMRTVVHLVQGTWRDVLRLARREQLFHSAGDGFEWQFLDNQEQLLPRLSPPFSKLIPDSSLDSSWLLQLLSLFTSFAAGTCCCSGNSVLLLTHQDKVLPL